MGPSAEAVIAVLLLLAPGCRDCAPLDEVPIVGDGDPTGTIAAAVASFVESAGADRVCLRAIDVQPVKRGDGVYNSVTRRIRIVPVDDPDALRTNVLHELCHAFDFQNDVVEDDDPVFRYAEGHEPEVHGEWKLAHEAFAEVCAIGPTSIHLLAREGCETGPAADAVAVVREEVYVGTPSSIDEPIALVPVATHEPVRYLEQLGPLSTGGGFARSEHGRLNLTLSYVGASTVQTVDPASGRELQFERSEDVGAVEPLDLPGIGSSASVGGWVEGPLLQSGRARLDPFGFSTEETHTLLAFDGERWSTAGCTGDRVPFELDDGVYVGEVLVDRQIVSWSRWDR